MRFLSHITALVLFAASGMYTHAQDVQNNDTPSISPDEFERLQSENKNYVKLLEDQLQVNKEQEQQHNEALKQVQQDAELRIKEAENTAQTKVDEAKSAADSAVKQAQQEVATAKAQAEQAQKQAQEQIATAQLEKDNALKEKEEALQGKDNALKEKAEAEAAKEAAEAQTLAAQEEAAVQAKAADEATTLAAQLREETKAAQNEAKELREKEAAKHARFPIPLEEYRAAEEGMSLWEKLVHRVEVDPFNLAVTIIFFLAVLHTFLAPKISSWAHHLEKKHKESLRARKFRIEHPEQRLPVSFVSTILHFLGEVEVVFGLWVIPFAFVCIHYYSMADFEKYINTDVHFTEPMFVAVVMVIAASRPIYRLAENTLKKGAALGGGTPAAWWMSVLCIAPLLGSFITEPAAMTLAAILLGKKIYQLKPSQSLSYATLALLFVNVSVGGTLTHFAAPPIVMISSKWDFGFSHMLLNFGWKAVAGIILANVLYFSLFRKEFKRLEEVQRSQMAFEHAVPTTWEDRQDNIPVWVYLVSIGFLAWTVAFNHYPALFVGGFMFFLGFTMATPQYQNHVTIKVPLLVAFFLAGLVTLGGVQGWWMEPMLQALSEAGAAATLGVASILTAFNDNASVTYLASTVPNLADHIKYAIVAGAVTGGGLTVIANAPNPAGQAILGRYFKGGINALKLFLWAFIPTTIMFLLFILTCPTSSPAADEAPAEQQTTAAPAAPEQASPAPQQEAK